ncbi:Delta serrate ligand family protein [Aphelenchoides avenae]|nr:Delta serrate ligand family protein [Aphelenchus avenae]
MVASQSVRRLWPWSICLIYAVISAQEANCSGTFEFEVLSLRPKSPEVCRGGCLVTVCLKQYQHRIDLNERCSYGNGTLLLVDDVLVNGSLVQLPFTAAWTKGFTLIVEATQRDSSNGTRAIYRKAARRHQAAGTDWQSWEASGSSPADTSSGVSELRARFRIRCAKDFYGDQCNKLCAISPLERAIGNFECSLDGRKQCMQGWQGTSCDQVRKCDCVNGACDSNGRCNCSPGYKGERCDECIPYRGCKGYCTRPYECRCQEGWGGYMCNVDLTYCNKHKPCLNGGVCTNLRNGSYSCQCPTGFHGRNCSLRIRDCRQQPCRNGASCIDFNGSFHCICSAGWKGNVCDIPSSWCSVATCRNGGPCIEDPSRKYGFRCECPYGLTGLRCELDMRPVINTSKKALAPRELPPDSKPEHWLLWSNLLLLLVVVGLLAVLLVIVLWFVRSTRSPADVKGQPRDAERLDRLPPPPYCDPPTPKYQELSAGFRRTSDDIRRGSACENEDNTKRCSVKRIHDDYVGDERYTSPRRLSPRRTVYTARGTPDSDELRLSSMRLTAIPPTVATSK